MMPTTVMVASAMRHAAAMMPTAPMMAPAAVPSAAMSTTPVTRYGPERRSDEHRDPYQPHSHRRR